MTYALLADVSTRLGRPITDPAEVDQVNAWLADVEALILTRLPDLVARVTGGAPSPEIVVMVEANAVVRKVKNPDGKQNEKIDDYSYGLTDDAARGDLFLTDAEWGLLTPTISSGAFSTRPYGAPDGMYLPLNWWELYL